MTHNISTGKCTSHECTLKCNLHPDRGIKHCQPPKTVSCSPSQALCYLPKLTTVLTCQNRSALSLYDYSVLHTNRILSMNRLVWASLAQHNVYENSSWHVCGSFVPGVWCSSGICCNLSILLLMNIWIVFNLGLLQIALLCIS